MASVTERWPFEVRERRGPDGSPIACHCFGLTEAQLIRTIHAHQITAIDQLMRTTEAGTGCTACRYRLALLLQRTLQRRPSTPLSSDAPCSGDCNNCPRKAS